MGVRGEILAVVGKKVAMKLTNKKSQPFLRLAFLVSDGLRMIMSTRHRFKKRFD